MREHDLELLELPAVLARLGGVTASEPGAVLAETLRPSPDAGVVRLRQQETSEAISLIEDSAEPDLGGATDVSEAAELAGRGSTLDTRTLMHIGRTIQAGVTARRALFFLVLSPMFLLNFSGYYSHGMVIVLLAIGVQILPAIVRTLALDVDLRLGILADEAFGALQHDVAAVGAR